jgi:uncharacterized membrane protein
MSFPDNILDRVSHIFDDDFDEILVFALLFIFLIFSGQPEDNSIGGIASGSGIPIVLIAIFLVLFLIIGNTREAAE